MFQRTFTFDETPAEASHTTKLKVILLGGVEFVNKIGRYKEFLLAADDEKEEALGRDTAADTPPPPTSREYEELEDEELVVVDDECCPG